MTYEQSHCTACVLVRALIAQNDPLLFWFGFYRSDIFSNSLLHSPSIFPIALGFVRELLLEPSLFAISPSLHVPANLARGGENLLNLCYSSRLKMLIRFFFPEQPVVGIEIPAQSPNY